MAVNPSAEVLARLRTAQGKASDDDLASLQGLNLRGRTLRFADLEESHLYAAALTDVDLRGALLEQVSLQGAYLPGADLRGAYLAGADLQGAYLREAYLQSANLPDAYMQGANLAGAQLQGADLAGAQLQGADLAGAQLKGANLAGAQLQGANLALAQLQGASLARAKLQGANLSQPARLGLGAPHKLERASLRGADLQGAYLRDVYLQGADLRGADLCGADLRGARLEGSDLYFTELRGADLRSSQIWQTAFARGDLSLADFRFARFAEPTDEDRAELLGSLNAISDVDRRAEVVARVKEALTPRPPRDISGVAVDKFVLVDDLHDMHWSGIAQDKKTSDEAEYDRALAFYLAELAKTDEFVAMGIAKRFPATWEREAERALWPHLARLLLDRRNAGTIKLSDHLVARLEKIAAPAAEAAAPEPRQP